MFDIAITSSEYFSRTQPAKSEELVNQAEMTYFTGVLAITDKVYESDELTLASGITQTIDIKFEKAPVKNSAAEIETISGTGPHIESETWYAWGGSITVKNITGSPVVFKLKANGQVLNFEEVVVVKKDDLSIIENGVIKYAYASNKLIQSKNMAETIAQALLNSFSQPRKDSTVNWIGNPAVELGDVVQIPEYQKHGIDIRGEFQIFKLSTEFDGSLRQTVDARKIVTYSETEGYQETVSGEEDTWEETDLSYSERMGYGIIDSAETTISQV